MKWIKHDSDAHMDAKMRRLIHKWGIEGYGVYWYCLELIANDVTAKNLNCELEHDAEILAHDLRMSREKVEDIMRYMVEIDLFESSQGRISCLKLFNRIDLSQGGSKAFRQAVTEKRAEIASKSHDPILTESCNSHDCIMTESCLDIEVDVEDRSNKGNHRKRFTPPSVDDVSAHCSDKGYAIDPETFISYYAQQGWKLSNGNPMKCWKSALTTWAKRNSNPGQSEDFHL